MSHVELIEWQIIKIDRRHGIETVLRHSEGAQTTFGLSRARTIAKKLGAGWRVVHATTYAEPTATEAKD